MQTMQSRHNKVEGRYLCESLSMMKKILEENHPLQAYLDDSKALIRYLSENDKSAVVSSLLFECADFQFLQDFFKLYKKLHDEYYGEQMEEVLAESKSDLDMKEVKNVKGKNCGNQMIVNNENLLIDDEEDNFAPKSQDSTSMMKDYDASAEEDFYDSDDSSTASTVTNYWDEDGNLNPYCYNDKNQRQTSSPSSLDVVETYEVVIIGAGASGIGAAISLLSGGLKRSNLLIIEKDTVGSSFSSWSPSTQFISPSVYSNPFGCIDLNSIDPFSSPLLLSNDATTKKKQSSHEKNGQHMNGPCYTTYLQQNASKWKIPIREHTLVTSIQKISGSKTWAKDAFEIQIQQDKHNSNQQCASMIYARFVIWCAGEWNYPRKNIPHSTNYLPTSLEGPSLPSFIHYSDMGNHNKNWESYIEDASINKKRINFDQFYQKQLQSTQDNNDVLVKLNQTIIDAKGIVIIGAFEAGIDVVRSLLFHHGEKTEDMIITLVDSNNINWNSQDDENDTQENEHNPDPSISLNSNSKQWLANAISTQRVRFISHRKCHHVSCSVQKVQQKDQDQDQEIINVDKISDTTSQHYYMAHLVDSRDDGQKTMETLVSYAPIILCTGFDTKQSLLEKLVHWKNSRGEEKDATPTVTTTADQDTTDSFSSSFFSRHCPIVSKECDESTKIPGIFLCGPMLRHFIPKKKKNSKQNNIVCDNNSNRLEKYFGEDYDNIQEEEELIFCFIYKFRTRFALVAGEILSRLIFEDHVIETDKNGEDRGGMIIDPTGNERLSKVEAMLKLYKEKGMYLADLESCSCACLSSHC